MISKKEKKNLNLALKSLIMNNKKKQFYIPLLNQTSRNFSLKSTNSNKTSINSNYSKLFIRQLQLKNKNLSSNKNINSLNNNNSHSQKIDVIKKININKDISKELLKNKSCYKYTIKNITEKTIHNLNNKLQKKVGVYKKIYNKLNNNNINNIQQNSKKNNIILNNLEYYYLITDHNESNIKTTKNNIININSLIKDKNKNNNNKEKKIFGIMLKKKSTVNNNFINKINKMNNNYYLYEKNLENRKNKFYKTNNNSLSSSLGLKKNKSGSGSNSNKLLLKKKIKYNEKNQNYIKNDIIIDYYNDDIKKNMNRISYNCNNSPTQLTNIPHLNRITINNYNYKVKKPLKFNLGPSIDNKKIHVLQNNNTYNSNNTINITIDNSVNNIYDNIININKNPKITFIKVNNNSTNSSYYNNKKLFKKNVSINNSYQNIIINFQKNKTKEKANKKIQQIMKENLKKIHEKKKKKKLPISFRKIRLNKVKLLGIKEIFSNFSKIKAKSPKFFTPKLNASFNNFNKIIFSGRFNRTEDKNNIDFFTSMNEKYKNTNSKIKENPQYVYEYFYEILNNLLIDENNYFEELDLGQLNINKNKNYINPESRKFFINSLINIQELLNFNERTLFLTTQIFDRYINTVLIKKNINIKEENLDIVIVTSLIIAAKNEEIKLYSMNDYLNLLPLKYNIHDLEKTEYEILSGFNFNLKIPSMLDFYEIFSLEMKFNKIQMLKGLYLLNFILLDNNLVQIPPSLIAFSVVFIICGKKIQFNKISEKYKSNGENKIIKILSILKDKETINNLCGYIKYLYKINNNSTYNAPFNKFNTPNYYYISSYLNI